MRVCLVSAPTITEFGDLDAIVAEDTPRVPLGVLTLAAELERAGTAPEILDLDQLYAAWRPGHDLREDFAPHATAVLAGSEAEVFGLSSICGTYPLTLRIASVLKEARPGCRIVLGGPQATATAHDTLAAFPAVDVVVRGEGERILPALLDTLAASRDLSGVAGIHYRAMAGIERTPDAPLLDDLDSLPLPSYGRYLRERRYGSVPLEVGRGCPFSCTFCSTSRFFGRRYRLKSPARIVQDMLAIHRAHGIRSFDLIHDNFTADRRRVLAFCEAVSSAAARFTWTCGSRTDGLDEDLLEIMHRAGCRGFFLGIESGSDTVQRAIDKRLDLRAAREVLHGLVRRKIRATLSFMVGFPEETRDDLGRTVSLYVDSLRHDFLEPQVTLLSPLAGTPMEARHPDELVCDDIVSDMAFQGEVLHPSERDLIARHPEIFSSFYSVPTRWLDRAEVSELRSFLVHTRLALRWLLVASAQLEGDGMNAFLAFRSWRARSGGGRPAREESTGDALRADFLRFVREELVRRHPAAAHAIRALVRYYENVPLDTRAVSSRATATNGPARAPNVLLTSIGCDGADLIRSLRAGRDLAAVRRRRSVFATRRLPTHDELVQISQEAAELLGLCDGRRDVGAVAAAFRRRHPVVGGIPAEAAARYGLELLLRRRLVTWSQEGRRRAALSAPSSSRAGEGRRPRPSTARVPGRAPRGPRGGRPSARGTAP
jgi:radical SAM superfamily enzyme YgiQ (UPF0313 family)